MYQIHLINAVLEWEKRLEIENERQKALHPEPHRELPTDFEPEKEECKSISVSISGFGKNRQSVNSCYVQEHCRETQAG
jgi:hypothetical protein